MYKIKIKSPPKCLNCFFFIIHTLIHIYRILNLTNCICICNIYIRLYVPKKIYHFKLKCLIALVINNR